MNEKAQHFISLSIDELFFEIGSGVDQDKHALPLPFAKIVEAGKAWYEENKVKLRQSICGSPVIASIKKESDTSRIIVTIADIISTMYTQVPPFAVAALILKLGIDKLCNKDD